MKYTVILLSLLAIAGLFAPVHAQEFTHDSALSVEKNDAPSESFFEKTNLPSETITNESADVVSIKMEEQIVVNEPASIDSAVAEPVRTKRRAIPRGTSSGIIIQNTQPVNPSPEPISPCLTTDAACPTANNDPCLVSDSVNCQPTDNDTPAEDDVSSDERAPLFSFNSLWVIGPVRPSNPAAGTLVTPPIPVELTETGPNPLIIGQADGRMTAETALPAAPEVPAPSITGLISGANLPWLGLLVLLVFGIFAWRGRKQ